jgi:Tuberin
LVTLLAYPGIFSQSAKHEIVQTFAQGAKKCTNTTNPCINALLISSFDLEDAVKRNIAEILSVLSDSISSSGVAVHILEFIVEISQKHALYGDFTFSNYHTIFSICLSYIKQHKLIASDERKSGAPLSVKDQAGSQYVLLLAYSAICHWFLLAPLHQRKGRVAFIISQLAEAEIDAGETGLDKQGLVICDFLNRNMYGNVTTTPTKSDFDQLIASGARQRRG